MTQFRHWTDAYPEAVFRAHITGRRYRVWYDPANRWWNVTELTQRHRLPYPEEGGHA
jgi:hypothetical protein